MGYIHGHNVSFDKSHDGLRKAAYHLEHEMSSDRREELFKKAKESAEKKSHFEISGYGHFKLKRENGQYIIAKSDNY